MKNNTLLKGIKVLDFSRILVGAYSSMLLADMGAEVIKIEPPNGDETRKWGPPFINKDSTYFLSINRNKKSICMNLKSTEAQDIIYRMVRKSDVIIENFICGKMQEFNLGYEDLKKYNEGIIYATVNSFGNYGEMKDKPAFDLIIQAYTGVMNITGGSDTEPFKVGYPMCDIMTGAHVYSAILAGILHKERTGKGQYINTSLFECNIFSMPTIVSAYLNAGIDAKRHGNDHPNISPYTVFKLKNGEYICIGVATDLQFEKLWKILNLQEDYEGFKSNTLRMKNRESLKSIIQNSINNFDKMILIENFKKFSIPYSLINSMKEIFNENNQIKDLNLVKSFDTTNYGNLKYVRNPITYSELNLEDMKSPPLLGEHTEEILTDIGFRDEEIIELKKKGIVS